MFLFVNAMFLVGHLHGIPHTSGVTYRRHDKKSRYVYKHAHMRKLHRTVKKDMHHYQR